MILFYQVPTRESKKLAHLSYYMEKLTIENFKLTSTKVFIVYPYTMLWGFTDESLFLIKWVTRSEFIKKLDNTMYEQMCKITRAQH